jgi:polysaccharide deacetylase family protein (PEP-CTERM system associated)
LTARTRKPIANALTIDVEDYFQVHAFSKAVDPKRWDSFDQRVGRNTYRVLDLLDQMSDQRSAISGQHSGSSIQNPASGKNGEQSTDDGCSPRLQATFFVLGWVAERFPQLVKEIHKRGHEVACHGYSHRCIYEQTSMEFAEDVKRAKAILEDIIGKKILGYRAPTYSITKRTLWALDILLALGFEYDSSIFPVKHDYYGFPEAPRFPFKVSAGSEGILFKQFGEKEPIKPSSTASPTTLIEYPLTTARVLGVNIPIAGGGYFRLLPYSMTKYLLKRVNNDEKQPFIFYFHPWEIDSEAPRIEAAGAISKFRTYVNLAKMETRLRKLLEDFAFCSLGRGTLVLT